jgi:hypothetical protein
MKFAVRGLTLVSVLAFLFMIFSFVRKENVIVVNDFTFILVSFCAALALFLTYRKVRFKDEKQVWLLLAAGSFVSFIAEVVWGYEEVILGVMTPSPGLVDALWIVGEAIILLAVFKQLQNSFFSSNANWCSTLAWVLGSVLLGFTISIFFILSDFSAVMGVSLIHVFIASLTLICAICLVWPLLRINSKLVLPWLFLCVAYFMFATEATLFAYESVSSAFHTGTFVDFIYVLGYIFLCLAAWAKSSIAGAGAK